MCDSDQACVIAGKACVITGRVAGWNRRSPRRGRVPAESEGAPRNRPIRSAMRRIAGKFRPYSVFGPVCRAPSACSIPSGKWAAARPSGMCDKANRRLQACVITTQACVISMCDNAEACVIRAGGTTMPRSVVGRHPKLVRRRHLKLVHPGRCRPRVAVPVADRQTVRGDGIRTRQEFDRDSTVTPGRFDGAPRAERVLGGPPRRSASRGLFPAFAPLLSAVPARFR